MGAPSVFRRWKRFFSSFEAVDAAIVASEPGGVAALIAKDLRHFKAEFVELLCDASDEERAEEFCKNLDELMVEYLVTLKDVPVKPAALKSTGVARAVAALQEHECERIRGLAREMLARWRAAAERGIADEAEAIAEELGKVSDLVPMSRAPVAGASSSGCHVAASDISGRKTDAPMCRSRIVRADTANLSKTKTPSLSAAATDVRHKMSVRDAPVQACRTNSGLADKVAMDKTKTPCHAAADSGKKTPSCSRANPLRAGTAGIAKTNTKTTTVLCNGQAEIEKMKATKRKLFEGYKEHEDAKRQRRIQIIETPKMVPEQRPVLRARSRVRCGAPPAAAKRSLMPAFQMI